MCSVKFIKEAIEEVHGETASMFLDSDYGRYTGEECGDACEDTYGLAYVFA